MVKSIFIGIFIFFNLHSFSQTTDWIKSAGGPNSEKGISIGTDSLGFIYISGFFNGTITFGATVLNSSSNSNKDMFVAKMDSFGNYIWAVSGGGGPFDDRALGMHVTPGGDVFITGTFWGSIAFPGAPGAVGNGHDTSLMTKIDKDGVCQWSKGFGASPSGNCPWPIYDGDDHSYDVKVDDDGFIYVTGFFSGHSAQFDAFTLNSPNWGSCQPSGYVGKMDALGNFIWVKRFDGIKDQRGSRDNRLAIDSNSNVFVIGGFENTAFYGPLSLTSNGEWDVFLFKMDKGGNWIWAKNVGSNKSDRGNGIAINKEGDVFITGEYRNPMYFECANASNGTDTLSHKKKRDVFVAKLCADGNWQWAKRMRSSRTDKSYQMSVDDNQQVFICGMTGDSVKFNNSLSLANTDTSTSAFVAQLDGSGLGDWVWAKMGGGPSESDRTNDITEDGFGNVYAIGFYELTANFDGNVLVSNGKKDVFIWKLSKANVTPSTVPIEYDTTYNSSNTTCPFNETVDLVIDTITCCTPKYVYNFDSVFFVPTVPTYITRYRDSIICDKYKTGFIIKNHIVVDFNCDTVFTIDSLELRLESNPFDETEDAIFCNGVDIELEAPYPGTTSWNMGDYNYPYLSLNKGGEYIVDFQIPGNICSLSDTIIVEIEFCPENCVVSIPTGFSPNISEGRNDEFKIVTNCPMDYTRFEFSIYNLWGEQIFYSENPKIGWDGYYKGEKANMGVYSYYIEYVNSYSDKIEILKGNISLIR